jgi:uncharacterized protein YerC
MTTASINAAKRRQVIAERVRNGEHPRMVAKDTGYTEGYVRNVCREKGVTPERLQSMKSAFRIAALYHIGHSADRIAVLTGASRSTIYKIIGYAKEAGLI